MKVLQVHDFVAPGNSRAGLDMCRVLADRGHDVHVMGAVGPLGPPTEFPSHTYPHIEGQGALAHLLRVRRMNREVFERTLDTFHPDALFFMQPLCTNMVLRSPRANGQKRLYHFFSPWAREYLVDRGIVEPSPWEALHMHLRRSSERKALNSVSRVLCASHYMKSQLLEQHPDYPADRITILSGAVDARRFAPTPDRRANDRFTVFTMRRLVYRMGLDLLIVAMAHLPEADLVIGGVGPELENLLSLAESHGVENRVRFVGQVPDAELPRLYTEADLVVLPTRDLEGFGLVLIEAMACGTPAMGTRVGGIPEVLEPLDPKLVIPARFPEAIADTIRRYMQDRDWQRSLRERCRSYVLERFSWDVVAPVLIGALS